MSTNSILYDAEFAFKDTAKRAMAGRAWDEFQEKRLTGLFLEGTTLEQMADAMQRKGSAVLSRLVELRLLMREEVGSYRYRYYVNKSVFIKLRIPNPYEPGASAQPQPQPSPKETTMSIITTIETKTFIDGVEASTITDEQLFNRIAKIEQQIETWRKIKNCPKKLMDRINEAEVSIQALVSYVDGR